jgi:hypothetical protein
MMHMEIVPTTAKISTGTSQLATDEGAALIPAKTSPGAAKTFINRPASDVAGAGGAAGGGAGVGSVGSMVFKSGLIHYLGKTRPKLQEMSVLF